MNIQRFCHGFCGAAGLVLAMACPQSAKAETFSFRLNGLGTSETSGDRTISGSMTLDGQDRFEAKTFDFDLNHGDRGDQQFLDLAIRNQGESILEAVFDIFGLESQSNRDRFDANVSGDINPTESQVNVELGEDMPKMKLKIKTPQAL